MLRATAKLSTTIFYIPLVTTVVKLFDCSGTWGIADWQCFSGIHLFLSLIATVVILAFSTFAFIGACTAAGVSSIRDYYILGLGPGCSHSCGNFKLNSLPVSNLPLVQAAAYALSPCLPVTCKCSCGLLLHAGPSLYQSVCQGPWSRGYGHQGPGIDAVCDVRSGGHIRAVHSAGAYLVRLPILVR